MCRAALALAVLLVIACSGCGERDWAPPKDAIPTGTYVFESDEVTGETAEALLAALARGSLGESGITAHQQWLRLRLMEDAMEGARMEDGSPLLERPTPLAFRLRIRLVLGPDNYVLHREHYFPATEHSSRQLLNDPWTMKDGALILHRAGRTPLTCRMGDGTVEVPYLEQTFTLRWESDSADGSTPVPPSQGG